ncbi:MAG: radical SAM protein [Candidatus Aminicenantaceae bacterium]
MMNDREKVYLIFPAVDKGDRNLPKGLLYVGYALKKNGFQVEILQFSPEDMETNIRKIIISKPLFVGFSVFTGSQPRAAAEISKEIKRRSHVPIVWGGVHTSLLPEQCLNEKYIDIVVTGEGEETATELADFLVRKESIENIKGIGFKEDDRAIFNPPRGFIKNLDTFKMDFTLIDVEKYIKKAPPAKRAIHFITSRGCPHRCSFCYNYAFNKSKWRAHSAEFCIKEITKLKEEFDIDGIIFHDDNFFVNRKRVLQIVKAIDMNWWGEIRLDYINTDIMNEFKKTKCRCLLLGWESGNNRILKLFNKGFDTEKIIEKTKLIAKFPDIIIQGQAIIGVPTETKEEINNTVKLALKLSKIHPSMRFGIGQYLPFPGTPLYELTKKLGWDPPKRTEGWDELDSRYKLHTFPWLPWANKKLRKKMMFISRYSFFLTRSQIKTKGDLWKGLVGHIFYYFVYVRLKFGVFFFPFEIYLFDSYLMIKMKLRTKYVKKKISCKQNANIEQ